MPKTSEMKEVPTQLSGDVRASRECRAKSRGLLKRITSQGRLFHEKASWRQTLPEVHKLLQLYCTITFSSTTAEKTFSVMGRMKTWLRSTKSSNNKLNSSMFAAIHKERIDTVSSECGELVHQC